MDAADVPTIESTLRSYGVDYLLTSTEFDDFLDELRNRENIMIVDAQEQEARRIKRETPIAVGDEVRISPDSPMYFSGTFTVKLIRPEDVYSYTVYMHDGVTMNYKKSEIIKVVQ